MYPNPNVSTTVKASVDDDLVTFPIYVRSDAKVGEKGTIYLPSETIKSDSNKSGKFMLSNYSGGNTLGTNTSYSKDYGIDVSKAKLNFVVASRSNTKGDVNSDGRINSNDALLVLQASTGLLTLSDNQKKLAEVTNDGKVNSSDALKILQFATGKLTKF